MSAKGGENVGGPTGGGGGDDGGGGGARGGEGTGRSNYVKNGGFEWPASGDGGALEWSKHGEMGFRLSENGVGRLEQARGGGGGGGGDGGGDEEEEGSTRGGGGDSGGGGGGGISGIGHGIVVGAGGVSVSDGSQQNAGVGGVGGAWQNVVVAQTNPEPLVLEGWSRRLAPETFGDGNGDGTPKQRIPTPPPPSSGIKSEDPSDYSLYADITFTDGSHRWAFVVPFSGGGGGGSGGGGDDARVSPSEGGGGDGRGGGAGWRHAYGVIDEDKPVRHVTLVLMYRHRDGAVMFDDVRLSPLREALCHLPLSPFV